MKKLNLANQDYFPIFSSLPEDHKLDERYFSAPDADGGSGPLKHWCLLGEITEIIKYSRPLYKVKDKAGKVFTVACYFDNDQARPQWMKYTKPGNTISVMYADKHFFMDGQLGIRLEDVERVNVYLCTLNTFLELPNKVTSLRSSKNCQSCKEYARRQCESCRLRYCDKECQKLHWAQSHKRECRAIAQIAEWKRKEWSVFHDAYWC
ncbi:hypothetical protein CPB83DRAFT_861638 [Crepidotus variabilis]|uniref:MYND-type domain-containing protein n=1 Tax=Crepidotus variabilis TaxID=179855 RepID=A0A9P6E843_9AGAR|nr:hypothetical protein CPB83DRAFT_861638 [Crepidotus variabilis]